jgi:AcrR family transcriptional regulator
VLDEPTKRAYDSPVRRRQAAETRARIVAAGAELVHESAVWDWRSLTVPAVAERAGVDPRTVYRHFPSVGELHDAVVQALVEESGAVLEGMRLEDVRGAVAQVFGYVSSFPITPRAEHDPTLAAMDQRRRDAALGAVAGAAPAWSDVDQRAAAGLVDVLWSVVSYERLVVEWGLDAEQAAQAVGWLVDLLEQAIRDGNGPGAPIVGGSTSTPREGGP